MNTISKSRIGDILEELNKDDNDEYMKVRVLKCEYDEFFSQMVQIQ